MENQTPEQIQKHISAAFDSVHLINQEIAKEKNTNRKKIVENNVRHLELMIGKEWFATALTSSQTTDINNCITAGNAYIA